MHFIIGFGIMLNNQFCTKLNLMREFVFCRMIKLNKWICAKKKSNGLRFYKDHDEVKEGQPNYIQVQLEQGIKGNLHQIQVQFG